MPSAPTHPRTGAPAHAFLNPLLDSPATPHRIVNTRSGGVLATSVSGAFDSSSRNKGLLGRDGLAPGEALVIAPSQAIHTWFMRFPIDVAFVTKQGEVVALRRGVRPWRLAIALRAFSVIEMPAGTLEASATAVGDQLEIL